MKRYFITGTDTDCGKTYVTRQLVDCYSNATAIKPVASGCDQVGNELISADALELKQNSGLSLDQINPWRYKLPVSPHIAAQYENKTINIKELADYCLTIKPEGIETLFIEGAGGLMVPLNEENTWIDFLKYTDIPVILVVGMKLGCINHALLSQAALKAHQIHCEGWIANCLDPDMLALADNIASLKSRLNFPLLGTVAFRGTMTKD